MLDVARFFGIFLVYYGHIIERMMYLKNPVAAAHYKFIYSFHMPFFFLLAGFTIAPEKMLLPVGKFLKRMSASRLVPYFAFSILIGLASLIFAGDFPLTDFSSPGGYLAAVVSTLRGLPLFNVPLWFMACLVTVEILHFVVGRFLDSTPKLVLAAVAFYVSGYYMTLSFSFFPTYNFWVAHEAFVVYAFYLVGVVLRRESILLGAQPRWRLLLATAICLLIVVVTYDMNTGPFRIFNAVVILASGHGNVLLFPLTALVGSLLILLLAKSAGANRFLMFLGENTLILFCLNGVFYHFFNGRFAAWFHATFPGHWVYVTGAGLAFTIVSLACCVPCIFLLNRFVPQLVGKPAKRGPLLPPFI